jgi:cyclophilin family peptidyl-prolyl cis-trans isomerase
MDDAYESDLPLLEKNQIVLPLHLTLDDLHSDVSDEASSGSSSSRSSGGWQQQSGFGPLSGHRQWRDQELPRWSSRPPSLSEESDLSSRNSVQNDGSQPKLPIPFMMVAFALVALAALYTSRTTVTEAVEHVYELQRNRDLILNQLTKTEKDFLMLRRQITAMDHMIQNQRAVDEGATTAPAHDDERAQELLTQMANLKSRLGSETSQVDRLKATVQERAKYEVREKYGEGILRVEMELIFPDRVAGPNKFVIQMASVDDMPHSVHTFLEMVSNGLLDGCSFILNALHVLKAAPLPYDGSPAIEKARAFTSLGLESVSFKEYHEKHPHKQYSVGFAADGSPSFYINTEDNSDIHAGDPCFGMIVDGIDAIRRLEAQPVRNGIWFEKRIGIKYARIIMS